MNIMNNLFIGFRDRDRTNDAEAGRSLLQCGTEFAYKISNLDTIVDADANELIHPLFKSMIIIKNKLSICIV
jgi:hypothetical protein